MAMVIFSSFFLSDYFERCCLYYSEIVQGIYKWDLLVEILLSLPFSLSLSISIHLASAVYSNRPRLHRSPFAVTLVTA